MLRAIKHKLNAWRTNEDGVAVVETALVFPVMLTMFVGIVDVGEALLVNKKLITSAQIVSDLLARNDVVDDAEINDAIIAGEQSMYPYELTSFGIDIVGIRFDEDSGDPEEGWRITRDMSEDSDVIENADGLGDPGEGVLAVTVTYTYSPIFSGFAVGNVDMRETAYVRGRRTPMVEYR